MDVIIYHNPDCGTSRNTLAMIRNAGVEPHIVEYLKAPPSRTMLTQLVRRMAIPVRALLREKGTPYAELVGPYLLEMGRDTLENWQSEFLQLLWQIGGLAYLFYVGSPQSKEGDDRVEAKIDEALRLLNPDRADKIIDAIDKEYAGRHTDPGARKRFS